MTVQPLTAVSDPSGTARLRASDLAYARLRAEIIDWTLAPGTPLGEIETSERPGVSRTPLLTHRPRPPRPGVARARAHRRRDPGPRRAARGAGHGGAPARVARAHPRVAGRRVGRGVPVARAAPASGIRPRNRKTPGEPRV